jgi:hypothetical protein
VRAAFKKSLGEALQGSLPIEEEEGCALSLVQIRDDIKGKVQEVETDLNALVRSMDRQIKKMRAEASGQSTQLTKTKQ